MAREWTQAVIQELIDSGVQESLTLDYKAAASLAKPDGKKAEITKDVSSFANSDGGTIIYGVAEYLQPDKKHLPEKLDPVDQTVITREWLEQVINTIRPHISGIVISPVPLSTGPNHVAYVVDIPKGTTAHQATDKRYYKRFNFQSVPMEDYEIRDVMSRLQHARIELEFRIEIDAVQGHDPLVAGVRPTRSRTRCRLLITAKNTGTVYAQYVNAFVTLHHELLYDEERELIQPFVEDGQLLCTKEMSNTTRDNVGVGVVPIPGPRRYVPILPGLSHEWEIELTEVFCNVHAARDDVVVKWRVHADNAPPIAGQITVKDIPMIDKRPMQKG
jgi:hypothetical protein